MDETIHTQGHHQHPGVKQQAKHQILPAPDNISVHHTTSNSGLYSSHTKSFDINRSRIRIENDGDEEPVQSTINGTLVSMPTLPNLQVGAGNYQQTKISNSNIHLSIMNDNKNTLGTKKMAGVTPSSQAYQINQRVQYRDKKSVVSSAIKGESPQKSAIGYNKSSSMKKTIKTSGIASTLNSINISDKNGNNQ